MTYVANIECEYDSVDAPYWSDSETFSDFDEALKWVTEKKRKVSSERPKPINTTMNVSILGEDSGTFLYQSVA